jgi:hypothetical protein
LKQAHDEGLISDDEYEAQKSALLDDDSPEAKKRWAGLKPGVFRMLIGGAMALAGLVFTTVSRANAEASGGGGYIVYYGLILVGLWLIGAGGYQSYQANQAKREAEVRENQRRTGGTPY